MISDTQTNGCGERTYSLRVSAQKGFGDGQHEFCAQLGHEQTGPAGLPGAALLGDSLVGYPGTGPFQTSDKQKLRGKWWLRND